VDLSRLLTQTVVVEHRTADGSPDAFGDPTESTEYSTFLGYVWQTSADERTDRGQIEREAWQAALERTSAGQWTAGDLLHVNPTIVAGAPVAGTGETFEVAGPPWQATNPRTGLVEYVLAPLDRSA